MKKKEKENKSFLQYFKDGYSFVLHDIWRITRSEVSKSRHFLYTIVKTLFISIRGFFYDKLQLKASALTYYTLFAMVPILALILAIASGFGFQDHIVNSMSQQFAGQGDAIPYVLNFVEKYLTKIKGGFFVGIGIVILLWSVMSVFRHIEGTFNEIWQVKKSRSLLVQFTTYFSLMLILPIFLVVSSGLSIFFVSNLSDLAMFDYIGTFVSILLKMSPYIINWLLFTALFLIIPNTKVKFIPAMVAGIFTGTFFQLFQYLYLKGQVFLTSYNVVYGSFAIIPLLLLWLQISWLIILLGAEISYASQNVYNFEFEKDAKNITPRYRNFLTLLITYLIIKRFEAGEEPPTVEDLTKENHIPVRLASNILNQLVDVNIIIEVENDKSKDKTYLPAVDINKISVSYLFEKIELTGSENFKVDIDNRFANIWNKLENIQNQTRLTQGNILIKDL